MGTQGPHFRESPFSYDTGIVLKCRRVNSTTGPTLKMVGSVRNVKRNPSHTMMSLHYLQVHITVSSGTDSSVSQISQCSISHCNHPSSGLKLLSTNVRSLQPKIDDLRGLCSHEHFDIIVATETWLSKCHLGLRSPYTGIQPHKEGSKSTWRWCCYLRFLLHPLQTAPTSAQ